MNNKLLWVPHILVTLALGLFGLQKVVMPLPELISFGMHWIEDFPAWQVRLIGTLEVLGVVGLNAPLFIKALPRLLIPISAAGVVLTMLGAVTTHLLRGDPAASVIVTSTLAAMCALIAMKRFGEAQARV